MSQTLDHASQWVHLATQQRESSSMESTSAGATFDSMRSIGPRSRMAAMSGTVTPQPKDDRQVGPVDDAITVEIGVASLALTP